MPQSRSCQRCSSRCTQTSRSKYGGGLEFSECLFHSSLLQQQVAELFACWDDRPGSYGKFLDCVFLVCSPTHQGDGFILLLGGLLRPGLDLTHLDADLRCPILRASFAELHFDARKFLRFHAGFSGMPCLRKAETPSPSCERHDMRWCSRRILDLRSISPPASLDDVPNGHDRGSIGNLEITAIQSLHAI